MLGLLIDGLVLMVLLKVVADEEVNFVMALLLALVASIVTTVLSIALAAYFGWIGIVVAGILSAAAIAAAVSAMFGVEIKRALVVGVGFLLVHIAWGVAALLMFRVSA
jgi:hypothetical protein